jgi:hypothetical protein
LGALLAVNPVVSMNGVTQAMEQLFGSNAKAQEMNKKALMKGLSER